MIRIESGDTVIVMDAASQQRRVRLAGIAAPHPQQDFGNRAQASLSALLANQEVSVDVRSQDSDGSLVGKMLVSPPGAACRMQPTCPKTIDAGLQQIADGLAWWHARTLSELTSAESGAYGRAEFDAKIHRRGLWASTNPTPPWKWPR